MFQTPKLTRQMRGAKVRHGFGAKRLYQCPASSQIFITSCGYAQLVLSIIQWIRSNGHDHPPHTIAPVVGTYNQASRPSSGSFALMIMRAFLRACASTAMSAIAPMIATRDCLENIAPSLSHLTRNVLHQVSNTARSLGHSPASRPPSRASFTSDEPKITKSGFCAAPGVGTVRARWRVQ